MNQKERKYHFFFQFMCMYLWINLKLHGRNCIQLAVTKELVVAEIWKVDIRKCMTRFSPTWRGSRQPMQSVLQCWAVKVEVSLKNLKGVILEISLDKLLVKLLKTSLVQNVCLTWWFVATMWCIWVLRNHAHCCWQEPKLYLRSLVSVIGVCLISSLLYLRKLWS